MNFTKNQLNDFYNELNKIFKNDNRFDCESKWNYEIFDYLLVNKYNTNNYLTGNFNLMLSQIDEIVKDNYNFQYDINTFMGIIERYLVITGEIVVDNIIIYDMKKYYNNLSNGNELEIIRLKKRKIDFNRMNRNNLKEKFYNRNELTSFITERFKLSNTFIDTDTLIKSQNNIVAVKDITKYLSKDFNELYDSILQSNINRSKTENNSLIRVNSINNIVNCC